ncbi:MAG: hypothetical protein E6G29_12305 [Actinobacteria bacterium]|nr:MAG: hypothetical protein E6G29_12305 [Actinomycetota bacterium]
MDRAAAVEQRQGRPLRLLVLGDHVAARGGHPPTDPYRDVIWQNGLFFQGFVAQWFVGQTAAQSLGAGVQPQILDRAQQEFVLEARLLPLDGPVYKERSVLAKMSRIKVPTYVFSGWSDMYSRGDLWLLDGLPAKHKLLWIDASTHHGTGRGGELDAPYAKGSPIDQLLALSADAPKGEIKEWLDRFVKGRLTASPTSRVCATSTWATGRGTRPAAGARLRSTGRACTCRPPAAAPRTR